MEYIDELRTYLRLCETMSFRRTSEESHVSPATLTRMVQRLEKQAGCLLVERSAHGIAITPDGLAFADFSHTSVRAWNDFRKGVEAPQIRGRVRLYATPTAAIALVPNLLRTLATAQPDISTDLETGDAASALARVLEGSCDVALVPVPDRLPAGVIAKTIARTPLVLVGTTESMRPALADRRYLLPVGGLVRDRANSWFRRHGAVPHIAAAPLAHEALVALAIAGQGVAIIPELVLMSTGTASELVVERPKHGMPALDIALCAAQTSLARGAVAAMWNAVSAT